MKRTNRTAALLLALVLLLGLAACSAGTGTPGAPTPAPAQKQGEAETAEMSGTLTVLSFTEYHDAIQAAIDAFQKAYPDMTVNLEEYPYAQYSDAVEIKLGSSSSDFDIIMTDATMVSAYAYKGWIAPLDRYFGDADKAAFASALIESSTFEDQFYSPPLCNSCQVLWYNKDLLDAAGVPYPSEDPAERLTWEEVEEISQSVMAAAKDNSVFGLTFEQVDRPFQVLPIPNSMGGDAFALDGVTTEGYLNGENFVKGMQWYSDIHNVSKISPKGTSPSDSVGLFTAGKIAFLCANIFDFATFEATEDFRYGFTPFPAFAEGSPASPTDSWHVSLSNFSKNQAQAVEFIKYITMGEGNDVFLDVKGAFAAQVDALNAYTTDSAYAEFPKTVFRLAAYEAQNTAYPRPRTLGYGEFEAIITSTFSDIRNGIDTKESLDAAVAQLQAQMSVYE